jgi:hemerythrin superfamily protein
LIESSDDADSKAQAFEKLADSLAIHAAIEEHQFYPSVKAQKTEDLLLESAEEHLGIKRVIADLMKLDADDETFDAKIKVLKELVMNHVEEEETDLFPQVKQLMSDDQLEELGEEMESEAGQLYADGSPRMMIPSETEEPAPL